MTAQTVADVLDAGDDLLAALKGRHFDSPTPTTVRIFCGNSTRALRLIDALLALNAPPNRPAPQEPPMAEQPSPSGRLVNEIIRLADVHEDLGHGRTRLRLSPARLRQREVRNALAENANRAAHVSVIFDEREEMIVALEDNSNG